MSDEIKLHRVTFSLVLATMRKLREFGRDVEDRYTGGTIWDSNDDAVLAILEEHERKVTDRKN